MEKVVEAGAWSDSESPIVKAVSAFPVAGKVFSGKIPYGNNVTIEQMSGVGCVESEPRYSAPWYSNIDVALMGIQSTAQFVEKYHHIIGEFTYLFVQLFFLYYFDGSLLLPIAFKERKARTKERNCASNIGIKGEVTIFLTLRCS